MPNLELPANDWLGYSMDLSRSATMDINAAMRAVLTGRRLINYGLDVGVREVDIGGVLYDVPGAVYISEGVSYQGNLVTYANGGDARNALRMDTGMQNRYFGVTGTATSVSLAHERSFTNDNQYAFYSFSSNSYTARLMDYADMLNATALLAGITDLSRPFNGDNSSDVDLYKSFFARYGSHVIVNTTYGARFQLNVWASNENAQVNAKFLADVVAHFGGIPTGGIYDPAVKDEPQYKIFQGYMQKLLSVVGGDPYVANSLAVNPSNQQEFVQWINSIEAGDELPKLLSFHTIPLWTLMLAFPDDTLRDYAPELERAFTHIITHTRTYTTAVTFDIQSTWAEFNLLTPSAKIIPDDDNPYPPYTVSSGTRVQWGKEHSHAYEKKTLKFFVQNDGSPIDFSISHGSNGAAPGKGMAQALFARESYINDQITDNIWNTVWFYKAPVSDVPDTGV